jgi:hypothetical protein
MFDFVNQLGVTWNGVFWGVLVSVVSFVGSLVMVTLVLVKLPATYFSDQHPPAFAWEERHPALRWTALIAKNALGAVLVIAGIIMSLPGVPGQGILTILIGLMLLNFPGKRRLEKKLVSRPHVLQAINRIRARFGKPPLVLDEESSKIAGEDPGRMKGV